MGYTSHDDLINQITVNGKYGRIDYNKTTGVAGVAGSWTDLGPFTGSTPADAYAGTSLTFVSTDDTYSGGAVYHGGNVSTATKHFLNASATVFAAAGAPWILMCVDQVGYVPITTTDVTGTGIRTVTMTALNSGSRWPDGKGLRAYFSTEVAPTAGGPNLTSFVYTDQDGNTGQSMGVTVGFKATPVAGEIPHSGNAATRYAPFLPLAVGDYGIRDIETFTLSGGTAYTGTGQLVLHLAVQELFLRFVQLGLQFVLGIKVEPLFGGFDLFGQFLHLCFHIGVGTGCWRRWCSFGRDFSGGLRRRVHVVPKLMKRLCQGHPRRFPDEILRGHQGYLILKDHFAELDALR